MARPKRPLTTTPRETLDLWPDVGRRLGFSRNFTYEAAKAGQIAGARKIAGKWVVFREPFLRMLEGKA